MKILYVITKGSWGGAQKYLYDLATAAQARGDDVRVACGNPGELGARLTTAGIRCIPLTSFTRDISFFKEFVAFAELRDVIRREQPNVLHVNSSKAGLIGTFAGRVCAVPRIIFTAHGWAFNEARPVWQKKMIRLLSQFIVLGSHITICVSDAVRRDIETAGNRRNLVVIKNGITCPILVERNEARHALAPDDTHPFWIGIIAELHPTKQIDVAIDAFARISAEHPNAVLLIMGEGEEREHLASMIRRKNVSEQVQLLGFVPQASSFLRAFDLFLIPSRSEAFAYVALEAGCAALPVIASRVGGLPEVIEDNVSGKLVPSGDARTLANELHLLILDPARRSAYGQALAARVASEFTSAHMIDATFALYQP